MVHVVSVIRVGEIAVTVGVANESVLVSWIIEVRGKRIHVIGVIVVLVRNIQMRRIRVPVITVWCAVQMHHVRVLRAVVVVFMGHICMPRWILAVGLVRIRVGRVTMEIVLVVVQIAVVLVICVILVVAGIVVMDSVKMRDVIVPAGVPGALRLTMARNPKGGLNLGCGAALVKFGMQLCASQFLGGLRVHAELGEHPMRFGQRQDGRPERERPPEEPAPVQVNPREVLVVQHPFSPSGAAAACSADAR